MSMQLRPTSIEKEIFPVMAEESQLYAMELQGNCSNNTITTGCCYPHTETPAKTFGVASENNSWVPLIEMLQVKLQTQDLLWLVKVSGSHLVILFEELYFQSLAEFCSFSVVHVSHRYEVFTVLLKQMENEWMTLINPLQELQSKGTQREIY